MNPWISFLWPSRNSPRYFPSRAGSSTTLTKYGRRLTVPADLQCERAASGPKKSVVSASQTNGKRQSSGIENQANRSITQLSGRIVEPQNFAKHLENRVMVTWLPTRLDCLSTPIFPEPKFAGSLIMLMEQERWQNQGHWPLARLTPFCYGT